MAFRAAVLEALRGDLKGLHSIRVNDFRSAADGELH
jgi:plasmid maintenance system killer protein